MSKLREAAQQALEIFDIGILREEQDRRVEALRAALAEPVQEPVAWLIEYDNGEKEVRFQHRNYGWRRTPLYTHPAPARVPLTDEQIDEASAGVVGLPHEIKQEIARAIERAHGIGDKE